MRLKGKIIGQVRVEKHGCYAVKFALFPKMSDCKKVSGILPTMTDSPTRICVVTAKFSVLDGITILMSAITFK